MSNKIFKETLFFHRENDTFNAVICGVKGELRHLETEMALFLTKKEIEIAKKMVFEKRRLSFLLGRYAAKQAICDFLTITNKNQIEIRQGVFGQPIVVYNGIEQIGIGITHTDDYAIAIAYLIDHPVGIDVESIDNSKTNLILSKFTAFELSLFTSIFSSNAIRNKGATIFWTVKEAMAKCIKTGLMTPLSVFEIDEMKEVDNSYISTFTNFAQYKAISYLLENSILTVVMPKKSHIEYASERTFDF